MTDSSSTAKKAASSLKEVQDTLSRIGATKGVEAIMILNKHGAILQSTWNKEQQLEHASLLLKLMNTATTLISTLDVGSPEEDNQVSFVRIHSKKQYEIMIAPDQEYLLVVLQKTTSTATSASS